MAATVRTSLSKLFICITMCLATLAIMSDPALGLRCKSDLSCNLKRKCFVIPSPAISLYSALKCRSPSNHKNYFSCSNYSSYQECGQAYCDTFVQNSCYDVTSTVKDRGSCFTCKPCN